MGRMDDVKMKWPEFNEFHLPERTFILCLMGSHSHGTYIQPKDGGIDDVDVMGVVVPPKEYYYGLQTFKQIQTFVDEYDIIIYEIKKFISLLLKNNPNVLGTLWLEDEMYKKCDKSGLLLKESREVFSSKLAYKSFSGYAYSQFRKMEPGACKGYMGEKRKKLVEQFGYDTKNAAHLIRLLRMGMEFLLTGQLNVMRHDSGQLIDIKRGEYKLEQIKSMAEDLFKKTEEAFLKSKLPNLPDYKKAEEILINIIEEKNGC